MNKFMKSPIAALALNCLLLWTGLLTILNIFLGQFNFSDINKMLAIAFCTSLVFVTANYILKKRFHKIIAFAAVGIAVLEIVYLLREKLQNGAQMAYSKIVPYIETYYSHEEIQPVYMTAEQNADCFLFMAFCVAAFAALLAWTTVGQKSGWLSFIVTLPLFSNVLVFREVPSNIQLTLMMIFWITLILQGKFYLGEVKSSILEPLICICVVVCFCGILFHFVPRETYKPDRELQKESVKIETTFMQIKNGTFFKNIFSSGSPITGSHGNVDLTSAGKISFPDEDHLEVHTDRPRRMYLRGYAASEYTGTAWLLGDEKEYEKQNFQVNPSEYLEMFNRKTMLCTDSSVEIKPLRKSKFILYPYYLSGKMESGAESDWYTDAFLMSKGQSEYRFPVKTMNYEEWRVAGLAQEGFGYPGNRGFFPEIFESTISYKEKEYAACLTSDDGILMLPSGTSQWQFERKYLDEIYADLKELGIEIEAYEGDIEGKGDTELKELGEEIRAHKQSGTTKAEEVINYYPKKRNDAKYFKYIMENYTKLPEGVKGNMLSWISEEATKDEGKFEKYAFSENTFYWNWIPEAMAVSELIKSSGKYTLEPGYQPKDKDFVEYFLTQSRKGYCLHFASATVVALRAIGIPARYVEGYVVDEKMFDENGKAVVTADKAHAWAEIWIPDFGWIPVEGTPSSDEIDEREQREKEESSASASSEVSEPEESEMDIQDKADTSSTPSESSEPEDLKAEKSFKFREFYNKYGKYITAFFVFTTILLLLTMFRLVQKKRVESVWVQEDLDDAALRVYAYLQKLSLSGTTPSKQAEEIALKAKFSKEKISEEEMQLLKSEFEQRYAEMKEKANIGKKITLFWRGL